MPRKRDAHRPRGRPGPKSRQREGVMSEQTSLPDAEQAPEPMTVGRVESESGRTDPMRFHWTGSDVRAVMTLLQVETVPTLRDIVTYCQRLTARYDEARKDALLAKGQAMKAAMTRGKEPPGVVTEEAAAELILSKLPPETRQIFEQTHLEMYPNDTAANIVTGLICALVNSYEGNTADMSSINRERVTLPASQGHGGLAPVARPATNGHSGTRYGPLPCGTCGTVFQPTRLGEQYGCMACGEYPHYKMIVEKDNAMHSAVEGDLRYTWVHRPLAPFPVFLREKQLQCTCGLPSSEAARMAHLPLAEQVARGYYQLPQPPPEQPLHPQDPRYGVFYHQVPSPVQDEVIPPSAPMATVEQPHPPDEYWGVDPTIVRPPVVQQERAPVEDATPRYPMPAGLMTRR